MELLHEAAPAAVVDGAADACEVVDASVGEAVTRPAPSQKASSLNCFRESYTTC